MHIAIVYDCLFPWSKGGAERLYRAYATEWAAAGHRVTYITRLHWARESPPQIPGVRVVTVSRDLELHDEHGRRTLGPAVRFFIGVLWHLLRRRRDYDAVLVGAIPNLNVLAARLGLAGTATVLAADWIEVWRASYYRDYAGRVVGSVAAALQRIAVRASPIVICYSRLAEQRLRDEGFRGDPVLAPGLIDMVQARPPAPDPPVVPTAIYVGRHITDKQVETLPAAIACAQRRLPELRAVILGDGPRRPAVEAAVAALGLSDSVQMPGFVGQEELDQAIRNASCLVLPSLREGYGLVIVEAAAAGTPSVVVVGEDNAAVELVDEGCNGFVASSTSPADLADAIIACVEGDSALRKKTIEWFDHVSTTNTVVASAAIVLERFQGAADVSL